MPACISISPLYTFPVSSSTYCASEIRFLNRILRLFTFALASTWHISQQSFALFLICYLPAVIIMILSPGSDSVIITFPHQFIVSVIQVYLLWNLCTVCFRNSGDIQLISKGSCQRNMSSGLEWHCSSGNMVWTVTDMCSDCR